MYREHEKLFSQFRLGSLCNVASASTQSRLVKLSWANCSVIISNLYAWTYLFFLFHITSYLLACCYYHYVYRCSCFLFDALIFKSSLLTTACAARVLTTFVTRKISSLIYNEIHLPHLWNTSCNLLMQQIDVENLSIVARCFINQFYNCSFKSFLYN